MAQQRKTTETPKRTRQAKKPVETKVKQPNKKPVRKQANTKAQNHPSSNPLTYEIIGLVLITLAVIQFFELGFIGRMTHTVAMFLLGNLHFFIPVVCIVIAARLMVKRRGIVIKNRIVYGLGCVIASLAIFSHSMLFDQLLNANALLSNSILKETWRILISTDGIVNRSNALGGGFVGAIFYSVLHLLFGTTGSKITAFVLLMIGIMLMTGKAFVPLLMERLPKLKSKWLTRTKKVKEQPNRRQRVKKEKAQEPPIISSFDNVKEEAPIISSFAKAEQPKVEKSVKVNQMDEPTDYTLPALGLLQPPTEHDQSGELATIQANARKLEQTLLSFGVKAKITQVHLGPAVTKYEIMPDSGVKVSKIVSLQDDLALALAAKDIRMEAPIPGKSAIGIEVPNHEVATVTLREVLEAPENNRPDAKLLIALGRDITGKAIMTELNKMPHLLVAGSTGSGKSVCINGIIVSLLMRAKPHEVKLMMIDPKMVELNVYNGIPHLLAPVVTEPRKAAQALQKVVAEMERRYDLFSHTGTRNVEGYNEHIMKINKVTEDKQAKLPYIVVIVDELADLMMVASSEVEDAITRLAQMARAAGIHLIIATQRPSVDVITGIIKANIPTRIAFAVSSAIDSRTILDMGGAERLLGRGDMLFLPPAHSKPTRIQGAFLSDEDVQKVVDFVIDQQKAQYEEAMIPSDIEEVAYEEAADVLYEEAVQLVTEMQSASVSMLQRKFRIGYSRAARIMDQMEARGVVGPPEGSKPRQVLSTKHH